MSEAERPNVWSSRIGTKSGGATRIVRRLPSTLTSFQILFFGGFLSFVILRYFFATGVVTLSAEISAAQGNFRFDEPVNLRKRVISQERDVWQQKAELSRHEQELNDEEDGEAKAKDVPQLKPKLSLHQEEEEVEAKEILQQNRRLPQHREVNDDDEEEDVRSKDTRQQKTKLSQHQEANDDDDRELDVQAKDNMRQKPKASQHQEEANDDDDEELDVQAKDNMQQKPKPSQHQEVVNSSDVRAKDVPQLKPKLSPQDAEKKNVVDVKAEVGLQQKPKLSRHGEEEEEEGSGVKTEDMWMSEWMPAGFAPKRLGLNPKNWDEQRAAWLMKYPEMKQGPEDRPRMLMVTSTSPWACHSTEGDHFLLKFLKNKIDYARQHEIPIFYNVAHLESDMNTFWAKLPLLRKLMLTHPEVEWFFWVDADAVFTDMLFEVPINKYANYNLVMTGYDSTFYKEKSWVGINDGVFFLRNCQWSLDLIDMWAPMGPEGEVREKAGKMLTAFLTQRPDMPADDQAALGYLILTKPEVQRKVKLVSEFELSGYWVDHVTHFEEYMSKNHAGVGDKSWPFVTHFPGCQICGGVSNPAFEEMGLNCFKHMERAFNFADNQVLHSLGFMHEGLESVEVKKIREDDAHPLEKVSANPWATASQLQQS